MTNILTNTFSFLKKSKKGTGLRSLSHQLLCYFFDGTSFHLTRFDKLKEDPCYGACIAHLVDGRTISVPLTWSWRLSEATEAQRKNYGFIGDGIGVHWPDIDEDISAQGMLTGSPAKHPKQTV